MKDTHKEKDRAQGSERERWKAMQSKFYFRTLYDNKSNKEASDIHTGCLMSSAAAVCLCVHWDFCLSRVVFSV